MTNAAITATGTETVGNYAYTTLSDGRAIRLHATGERWVGKFVEIDFIDLTSSRVGEFLMIHRGTSMRLALDAALAHINA